MKKIIVFSLMVISMLLTITSCADSYVVETVYTSEYRYIYSQPYSRVIIRPMHHSRHPHYTYNPHIERGHHMIPRQTPPPQHRKPDNNRQRNYGGRR